MIPHVKAEIAALLDDSDHETCLSLGDTDIYTFDAGRWVPPPRDTCWFPGLVIKQSVPDTKATSFIVTITGHHIICSKSHFIVSMRYKKNPGCELAGAYRECDWHDAVQSGGLSSCVASCLCEGDDCKFVTIEIPRLYESWKICEIDITTA